MTPCARALAARIRHGGPLTIADFMAEALLHPRHGYYTTRDPLGRGGDFTTAPEISQMFGELIGLALAQIWRDQGAPAAFTLAELGPGRGTLMADILRATRNVAGFHAAAQVHLVEASPVLRGLQAKAVPQAHWHDDITTLPAGTLFLVANEFYDALPIRQFIRAGDGWAERLVTLSGEDLAFALAPPAPVAALAHRLALPEGKLVEYCPALPPIMAEIAARIARFGGAALMIDYGDWDGTGDTLQALRDHAFDPPLAHPGEADLTAHVDFKALADHAGPARATPMATQGAFLERLGIAQRAMTLAERLTGAARDSHIAAHRRLTHPAEMGHLFKIIGIAPQGAPPLPGLDL